jgi:hypothetical protein
MQEDVESLEARELVYATDTDGRAEWSVNSEPRVSSAEGFPQASPRDRRQRRGR